MGVSHSSGELVSKLRASTSALQKPKGALQRAAQEGRITMVRAPGAARAVGGKRIDVRTRSVDDNTVSLKWGPPGWVRILNDPTQPHFIARRTGRGKKSMGHLRNQQIGSGMVRGAIGIPGIGPRAWAFHPGTKGKHFVEKGKRAAIPVVQREFYKQITADVAKPFR